MPPISAPAPKKGLKITRALKSAARLPARVTVKGSGRNAFAPVPGENPIVIFRLQVVGCKDLLAKDRNGFSDPFVVASILSTRHQTPVSKRTVNPEYAAKDATFDFPIYLSLADHLGVLELVVWDKDMLTKDYLGEVALPLEDWFTDREGTPRPYAFDDPASKPLTINLLSTRANTPATGTVEIKFGFVTPPNTQNLLEYGEIFSELVKRSRPSLVSAPPTEGVGTVRSHQGGPAFEDDGGLSSDEELDDDDFVDADDSLPTPTTALSPSSTPLSELYTPRPTRGNTTPVALEVPKSAATPPQSTTPQPGGKKSGSQTFIPKIFPRRISGFSSSSSNNSSPTSEAPAPEATPRPAATPAEKEKKKMFRKSWSPGSGSLSSSSSITPSSGAGSPGSPGKDGAGYSLETANDIVGIVMLEIQRAEDLPRLKNMTRTGWDMDPFVVISFGKKVFRTRVIRHSRNPVWDEKLLFHVRRYETAFKVQLAVLDWDKLSSNDHVGDVSFDVRELLECAPQPDAAGMYAADEDGDHPMREFKMALSTTKEMPWEAKHNPAITFRAKYQPYDALRQRFWRQYLKQYDTDDTGDISHLELTSMLDSLGSTLTRTTLNSFFTRYGKKPHRDELTVAEAIQCLETELMRPDSERKRLDADDNLPDSSVAATPVLMAADRHGKTLELDQLNFAGPMHNDETIIGMPPAPDARQTEPATQSLAHAALGGEDVDVGATPGMARQMSSYSSEDDAEGESSGSASATATAPHMPSKPKKSRFRRRKGNAKTASTPSSGSGSASSGSGGSPSETFERVINVRNCPLCHRPRLNSKAEMDIITHLAICASQDWNKVDRIVVGNFVTASQAQRKWYTKVLSKVSSGDYKLGANSANIIVQNRMTGQLEEEKMQVYVRLGIRLLYKGAKGRMEGGRARRLLKSLSIKQGVKYDAPESARDIPAFIEFHQLKVDEIQDPLDSFKTFNQFFYRKLKASARPVERPDDPYRLVSAADCRLMAFETVTHATQLWIKGREFTVARLLGDAYKNEAERYTGGALAIFRLAPQDYHRFHSPVDGTVGNMTYIAGEYYTVNPQAIRTALDVYGENARKIVPIDSPQFGRVMAVCIGAMMVGSIQTTVKEGEFVRRGQEFGYFAFGGSTIVLLFEKGVLEWDEDLLINGRASLETLVRVGMGIGTGKRPIAA
ncbi:phosphatidylserine decarboxylase-domain-containing protein [Infundibulicybe gibba]|nr:phosphatidylserine decarboxylase-domain-containing protein [Infundibulicybe gibba]